MVPSVTAVVVNWNHGDCILDCLQALQTQNYPATQVIVVDNGSTDGSPDAIALRFPAVELRRWPANRGFAAAFNNAARGSDSAFVLSANPDVIPQPDFISELVSAITQDDRLGAAAPKLLWTDDPRLLDSTGLFIDRRRGPYDRGQGQPDHGQFDTQRRVFGACGAAALYRRTMLEDVAVDGEFMDEDFFAYYEDADLAWRAQLRGWECAYVPDAVARHARGWGDTLRKRRVAGQDARGVRLALRNRYLMTMKNDAASNFLKDLPLILGAEAARLAYATIRIPRALLGITDLCQAWPAAVRKRRLIRSRRTVSDEEIRRWMTAPQAAEGAANQRPQ
jgi:GT2 family glycosyltransferase